MGIGEFGFGAQSEIRFSGEKLQAKIFYADIIRKWRPGAKWPPTTTVQSVVTQSN
jgi:hypothetical protein